MTPEIKKEKYVFYSCTNARGVCHREYVPERTLLEPVYDALRSIQLSEDMVDKVIEGCRAASGAEAEFHRKEISRLENEYNILQNRIEGLPALLLDRVITREVYDAKLKEWKDKQYDLNLQMEDCTRADETYLVTMGTVLNLARRAVEIFEGSEIPEKRLLLKYLLQNPRVESKKLLFELRTPFDTIALVRNGPMRLPVSVTFRTLNWEEIRRDLAGVASLLDRRDSALAA